MDFTYDGYRQLIDLLEKNNYVISDYKNWRKYDQTVILRHDIDNDISKALDLAKLECDLGITSTYFVLVTSDFYNILSAKNENMLKEISKCGHGIGLHFDEVRYTDINTPNDAVDYIVKEAKILSYVIEKQVDVVSMHRPSKMILDADLNIPGIINSYGQTFFKDFKYLSDSRRRWREPIADIVNSKKYDRLHVLTHAIWYNDFEKDLHDSIFDFVNAGNRERYIAEQSNITDLQAIMHENEIK